ncbi:MAG TPA: helix-turn-helix domain-containing protein, partial [Chloroflexota bacterium]|nr:helix-turn-helix domain-containing protein [Chloroflexota bacterium]
MAEQAPPAFKDLLRRSRLEAGLSQEALAERAGLSVRAISDLERGVKRWPRPETLQLLAVALNLTPEDRTALASAGRRPSSPRISTESRQPHPAPPPVPTSNLPVQLTSFIGREREQTEVRTLLETHHLVTIAGPGGAGKTRLALQVAGDLVSAYPDGVWLVELAQLSNPTLVPQEVASVLGLREQPDRALSVTIAEYLKSRQALLVLDNCEHLISACLELVAVLLGSCPQLRVLVTSREGLRVPGETIYQVPSLSLPDPGRAYTPEQLLAFEAIQLFMERVRERRFDFALTAANASAVAQICCRLDGIPLAIELAAARIGVLSAEDIAERLADAFRLLASGPRTAPPRHQTLRAALDWSHTLLGEQEQALLRRLSVFGGWTLDAAEAVCAGDLTSPRRFASILTADRDPSPDQASQTELLDRTHRLPPRHAGGVGEERPHFPVVAREEILDLLDTLVNKSLVLMQDVGRPAWYRLLETVRQYERERLE